MDKSGLEKIMHIMIMVYRTARKSGSIPQVPCRVIVSMRKENRQENPMNGMKTEG